MGNQYKFALDSKPKYKRPNGIAFMQHVLLQNRALNFKGYVQQDVT
jgi:hypothetical protein